MTKVATLTIKRRFTKPKSEAYDSLAWEKRDAKLVNPNTNEIVFEQSGLEFPTGWSQNAVDIVAQKYFAGTPGTLEREYSMRQLINRVVDTITQYGLKEGYFQTDTESEDFCEELKYALATQMVAFNSPVWFNIGVAERTQQASACFILNVDDTLPSIMNWYVEESYIFKGGSGSGLNVSKLRSSVERLSSSGGYASGPVSFMRGADASAGTIKSGGKTRRAAKMVIINADHPDVEEFIWCKAIEERKSRALSEAGFDMSLNGVDAFSVQYQNANNSVRVTDEFMRAVEADEDWDFIGVTDKKVYKTIKARDLFRQIAQAAWECADPGVQFDTTINKWHTAPKAGRINASNPCSEYMHLDNSACNLASLNLLKFLDDDGVFQLEDFLHVVGLMITAQEILVGYSEYPTKSIAKTAKAYRELGIGYANLGALLMAQGLPYDSGEGRAQAATITAMMTGHAYATSAKIAQRIGAFAGYDKDRVAMNKVLKQHRSCLSDIDASLVKEDMLSVAASTWDEAIKLAELYGVRNSQVSVLAPTGTIGLMMDCDTTGIEPDLGLVKYKTLSGGGAMTFVNQTVARALGTLGYSPKQTKAIVKYVDDNQTIVGAPGLQDEHLPVFACAMGNDNTIHYLGHVKMMAAVQPFLSGAISKTVNMPEDATVEDVEKLHMDAWKMGVKAIAIYRDNCKVAQPLKTGQDKDYSDDKKTAGESVASNTETKTADGFILRGAVRRNMPRVRRSKTYEFKVADSKGFVTVGEFEDGTPGEIFVKVAKQGSTFAGIMDAFAISVSHGLQYGVPLKSYVKSFTNMLFAPSGLTDDPEVRTASSFVDYIFRRLAKSYLSYDDLLELGLASPADQVQKGEEQQTTLVDEQDTVPSGLTPAEEGLSVDIGPLEDSPTSSQPNPFRDSSAPMCFNCGNQTQRSGSCYVCAACGQSTGCS